jgi:NADH dehydrogenase FAD-containing subunit/uncharacterized membrane protein YphA (DoxX/SURF4 family)
MGENRNALGASGVVRGTAWLLQFYRATTDFCFRVLRGIVWPKIDLGIRLWLAGIFLASGLLKFMNWDTALELATHEYPVSWLSPATAACVGIAIEVLGGALLALGFMTRYAALAMLALTLVSRYSYLPVDSQLYWAVLFGWYAIHGAGLLSLDALLRFGLQESALPIVPSIIRVTEVVRTRVGPWYLSALRGWLGAAMLTVAANHGGAMTTSAGWAPVQTLSALPAAMLMLGGVPLLLGIGTRYVAALLLIALSTSMMMHPVGDGFAYLLTLLTLLLIQGAGPMSLDAVIDRQLARRLPELTAQALLSLDALPSVVIVGAGFGGMACASALRTVQARITLIDRTNFHLFQPLLYQVATAGLSPGDIAAPVRPLFRDSANTRVLLGEVTGIETQTHAVLVGEKRLNYDYLVLATGATHSYFGKDHWANFAPGLKRIEDATEIRRRILSAFELAESTEDEEERARLLTFLIVGGGPTGVELAGAIAELARHGMKKEFRNFDPATARVILVQSAPRLLPAFPEQLSEVARHALEKLGVEVMLACRVNEIDATGVLLNGEPQRAGTVLWAAGVKASPVAQWLALAGDSAGRVSVESDLSVPGNRSVFVIGDAALSNAWQGAAVPGLAPAAKQAGVHVARVIRASIEGRPTPEAFVYRHMGSLATIGRKSAVADFGFIKLWGAPAWWLWGVVHIGFLVGLRNRVSTMVNWLWSYLSYGGGIRLITGSEAAHAAAIARTQSAATDALRQVSVKP